MGNVYSLPSFTFPEITEIELKNLVASITGSDLKFERILGKIRISWSLLVRKSLQINSEQPEHLYLMRLYPKNASSSSDVAVNFVKRVSTAISVKLNFIHELYFEKCRHFEFVLKPTLIKEMDQFIIFIRPFGRFNLPDRILTESLHDFDKHWITYHLLEHFKKLHSIHAYHGDFTCGKVILSSEHYKIFLADFAPVKPFRRSETQSPIEFYQLWFDDGLGGESKSVGRGCYLAPERLNSKSKNESLESADLFSLGCVLAEVFGSNGESFLTFQDVLLLSTASDQDYVKMFDSFLERMNFDYNYTFTNSILPIILNLCKRIPEERKISFEHQEILKQNLQPEQMKWNELFEGLKLSNISEGSYEKTKRTLQSMLKEIYFFTNRNNDLSLDLSQIIVRNFVSLLLFCLSNPQDKLLNIIFVDTLLNMLKNIRHYLNGDFFIEFFKLNYIIGEEGSRCRLNMFLNDFKDFIVDDGLITSALEFEKSGNREILFNQIYKETNLLRVFNIVDRLKETLQNEEKIGDILSKLLQIYRARGIDVPEFEEKLFYEQNSLIHNDAVDLLEIKLNLKATISTIKRIAFQLDLKKNRVPIENSRLRKIQGKGKKSGDIKSGENNRSLAIKNELFDSSQGKLKQRMITQVFWKMENHEKGTERIKGIIQSDQYCSYFIIFSNEMFYFWDFHTLMISKDSSFAVPFASTRPRPESDIESVIFVNGNMIGILFADGIIGIYKIELNRQIELSISRFTLVESYGPFETICSKLMIHSNLLFIIGDRDIIGIDPAKPRKIQFHYKMKINNDIGTISNVTPVEGCLLLETRRGYFILIDLFYQTGQELGRWNLNWDTQSLGTRLKKEIITRQDTLIFSEPNPKGDDDVKIIKKYSFIDGSRLIKMYDFDSLALDLKGSFSNWLIPTTSNIMIDAKSSNLLKLSKQMPDSNDVAQLDFSSFRSGSLVEIGGELLDCTLVPSSQSTSYINTIRLIDFKNFSAKNASSVLFPPATNSEYKPSLKLRNRKGQTPEIIERYETDGVTFNSDVDTKDQEYILELNLCVSSQMAGDRTNSFPSSRTLTDRDNIQPISESQYVMSHTISDSYDFIVLGTGITECVLSGILSMEGYKVLHLDRNAYYGGEGASLTLSQLFERFNPSCAKNPQNSSYGRDRDYCIDLIPKFLMASGEFVDILSNLDLSRYIEFVQCEGSFVYREGNGICKVPSTPTEAATSSLMGFFEKRRAKGFFQYCVTVDEVNPSTWSNHNLFVKSMADVFKAFDLDSNTIDFIGHSLALQSNDSYLKEPALETIKKIKLYMNSIMRFGKSPYLYPLYGLGELPQGFARLSAIYGGIYMLDTAVDGFVFDQSENVKGIRISNTKNDTITTSSESDKMIKDLNTLVVSDEEKDYSQSTVSSTNNDTLYYAPKIICDPSYAPDRVCLTHRVIRAICLLNHPIPSTSVNSCQIILPQRQLGRRHDIYVSCVSSAHNVCPAGYYLAQVSTIVETANPEQEIAPALALLGPILEKFVSISNLYEPITDGTEDGIFISKSLDSSTHFETVCEDVKNIYQRIFGKQLQLTQRPSVEEEQSRYTTEVLALNDNNPNSVQEV